jgi:hypothetical protein
MSRSSLAETLVKLGAGGLVIAAECRRLNSCRGDFGVGIGWIDKKRNSGRRGNQLVSRPVRPGARYPLAPGLDRGAARSILPLYQRTHF